MSVALIGKNADENMCGMERHRRRHYIMRICDLDSDGTCPANMTCGSSQMGFIEEVTRYRRPYS